MKKGYSSALLSLLAAVRSTKYQVPSTKYAVRVPQVGAWCLVLGTWYLVLLVSGQGNGVASTKYQVPSTKYSVASKPLGTSYLVLGTSVWFPPIPVSSSADYDNSSRIAASPIDGAASFIWGRSNGTQGFVILSNNHSLGGPFGPDQTADTGQPNQIDVIGAAHDSAGRRHLLSWHWPTNGTLCDYYRQVDTNGNVVVTETVPGSCDGGSRKLGGIAVDASLTVHILLGRNGVAGSMRYWQRTNAGVWSVQAEALPSGCSPSDQTLTISSQGTVMAAFKDCPASGQGSDIFTAVRVAPNNWQVDNISAACCTACPNISGAYLPHLAAVPEGSGQNAERRTQNGGDDLLPTGCCLLPTVMGGIRAAWADGRCTPGGPTDIYYREWVPGSGWNGTPIVQVVNNSGLSYSPVIAVDATGEAHILWEDDTGQPYSHIFYSHGHGTVFTAPEAPFDPWFAAWQSSPTTDFAFNAVHVGFSSNRDDPNKNPYYSYTNAAPPPTPTPTPPPTPTPAPPPCPGQHFTDVCPGTYYYTGVTNLVNASVIGGYSASPPCPASSWIPCFLPGNSATRGQVAKIITLGANLPINTGGGPHFTDVLPGSTFYSYVETMYNAGIIGGYTTGCTTGSPCFKPNNNVTRGQLTKMASLAFNFNEPVSGQTFQDVAPGSTYYTYTQRLNTRGIINGYPCGGVGEPCLPPGNRPYFRPNNNVTRGQIAKIVDLCRQQP
jgi:hypothetical protein